MLSVVICDDNIIDAQFSARKIGAVLADEQPECRCFSHPEELLSAVERGGCRPDIAVLDIEMDSEMDGIDLAERLNRLVPDCAIIFLTGYEDYCSDVYRTEHLFFVGKARVDQYLPTALEKAVQRVRSRSGERALFRFSINGTFYCVPADQVLFLEHKLRKTQLVTAETRYAVSDSPGRLIEESGSKAFIRCHQNFWVNAKYVRSVNAREIRLTSGDCVPVSQSRAQSAKAAYFAFLGKTLDAVGE